MSDGDALLFLLVEHDERAIEVFRTTLEVERRVKLVVSPTCDQALRMLRDTAPDLVVVGHDAHGMNVFAFCQRLRQDPALAAAMLVLVIDRDANDQRFAGLTLGVDEYLARPLEPAEILTKVHAALRLKHVVDAHRGDQKELAELHTHLRESFDQLLGLMSHLLDLRIPGAADRGRRIAELALKVSGRFGIPATHLRDLEIAARLHELGRVVFGQVGAAALPVDDWKYVLGTRAIFQQVEGLTGAAEVVGAVYENWDGSGHPDHLQLGQLPLRSRILRVLIDLFHELDSPGRTSPEAVLERLQNRVGTHYDPMVMVHLRAVMQGIADPDVQGRLKMVAVPELAVGMVLAEDLCTDSGLKLLARHTRLTLETLEVIRRRHASEPLARGAAVLREST